MATSTNSIPAPTNSKFLVFMPYILIVILSAVSGYFINKSNHVKGAMIGFVIGLGILWLYYVAISIKNEPVNATTVSPNSAFSSTA